MGGRARGRDREGVKPEGGRTEGKREAGTGRERGREGGSNVHFFFCHLETLRALRMSLHIALNSVSLAGMCPQPILLIIYVRVTFDNLSMHA